MKRELFSIVLVFFGLAGAASGVAHAGETVTYRGTGTFVATKVALPLANGGAAVHLANNVVATIKPSESGYMLGDCAGLGYMDAEGGYSVRAYCTFAENGNDGFAIEASVEPAAGGTVKVIGGSGKWAGASGDGTLSAAHSEGNRGSYDYEFRITTP